jgi:hypothetical protein
MSTTSRPLPRCAERDAERGADLGASAERLTSMAVGLVEIPQFVSPVLQRVGGQHPIFVLDDVPDLAGEPRQRDRHAVPIGFGLFAPGRKQAVVLCAHRIGAFVNARGKPRVFGNPFSACLRQRRDRSRGVAEYAQAARRHARVIHRPFA